MTVFPFSPEILVRLLVDYSEGAEDHIASKRQSSFLQEYLQELKAATVVCEPGYIDRDFLRDFSAYYVTCFYNYARTTTRLHFFSASFDQSALVSLLSGTEGQELSAEELQDHYLGFVVVRPLPETVIGRTCLRTYPTEEGRRTFPVLQQYPVNLFGIPLSVLSLAFQEQDRVAAACATSALWSSFQATGRYFHHPIPSPTEITRSAAVSLPDQEVPNTRAFPNAGLSATQMANAILAVGLEPQVLGASNAHLVKSTLYAYLKGHIAPVLGVSLYNHIVGETSQKSHGRHAVAVTGYSMRGGEVEPYGYNKFLLRSSRLTNLYVHDDQLGPFARMRFVDLPTIGFDGASSEACILLTNWPADHDIVGLARIMVLPLYNKIRIPFHIVHDAIMEVDALLNLFRQKFFPESLQLEWDIYLTTGSEFKTDVLKTKSTHTSGNAVELLTAGLPRFVWRASAYQAEELVMDLLLDATGVIQSNLMLFAKVSLAEIKASIIAIANGIAGKHIPGPSQQAMYIIRTIANPSAGGGGELHQSSNCLIKLAQCARRWHVEVSKVGFVRI